MHAVSCTPCGAPAPGAEGLVHHCPLSASASAQSSLTWTVALKIMSFFLSQYKLKAEI